MLKGYRTLILNGGLFAISIADVTGLVTALQPLLGLSPEALMLIAIITGLNILLRFLTDTPALSSTPKAPTS